MDQPSIVGSDSMDDAEAAGVERAGGIAVVELSPYRSGQLERKWGAPDRTYPNEKEATRLHQGKKSTPRPYAADGHFL